jgi:hypothetical protein
MGNQKNTSIALLKVTRIILIKQRQERRHYFCDTQQHTQKVVVSLGLPVAEVLGMNPAWG